MGSVIQSFCFYSLSSAECNCLNKTPILILKCTLIQQHSHNSVSQKLYEKVHIGSQFAFLKIFLKMVCTTPFVLNCFGHLLESCPGRNDKCNILLFLRWRFSIHWWQDFYYLLFFLLFAGVFRAREVNNMHVKDAQVRDNQCYSSLNHFRGVYFPPQTQSTKFTVKEPRISNRYPWRSSRGSAVF